MSHPRAIRKTTLVLLAVSVVLLLGFLSRVDAATTYSYDSLNRLSKATYPDGTVLTYTYDAAGNRLTQVGTGYVSPSPPTNQITAPTPGLQVVNPNYTITGKAGDNVAVSNVMYQLNGCVARFVGEVG